MSLCRVYRALLPFSTCSVHVATNMSRSASSSHSGGLPAWVQRWKGAPSPTHEVQLSSKSRCQLCQQTEGDGRHVPASAGPFLFSYFHSPGSVAQTRELNWRNRTAQDYRLCCGCFGTWEQTPYGIAHRAIAAEDTSSRQQHATFFNTLRAAVLQKGWIHATYITALWNKARADVVARGGAPEEVSTSVRRTVEEWLSSNCLPISLEGRGRNMWGLSLLWLLGTDALLYSGNNEALQEAASPYAGLHDGIAHEIGVRKAAFVRTAAANSAHHANQQRLIMTGDFTGYLEMAHSPRLVAALKAALAATPDAQLAPAERQQQDFQLAVLVDIVVRISPESRETTPISELAKWLSSAQRTMKTQDFINLMAGTGLFPGLT